MAILKDLKKQQNISKYCMVRGHLHSTYPQMGRGGVKPNVYDCVQGGRGVSRLRPYAKKKFFLDHKISKLFFFCTKKAITLPYIIVHRKV